MVRTELAPIDVAALDAASPAACAAALAGLFEGAPRFLDRLCASRPFGDDDGLFDRALEVALAAPEEVQIELVDAHPRLGAPPEVVSAASFREQGYDREVERRVDSSSPATELEALNDAYEARFGFRYCVFVAGRSRETLLPGFRAAFAADRTSELRRALSDVVAIARDRHRRAVAPTGGVVT